MTVIRDIPLTLQTQDVLRREGLRIYPQSRPEIEGLVLELLNSVERTQLLKPAVAYEIYPINGTDCRQLSLEKVRRGAKELAAVVGTIGHGLEKQVTEYFKRGEPLRGVLLDGIGSAAVDTLTQEACKLIAGEASSRGYQTSSPISPGMPGLPIAEQWQLFKLVPAREIGVSLTTAGIMMPRKSVSMVIGIGPRMKKWTQAEVCARCCLGKTCRYRIPAYVENVIKKTGRE
jgi:hypothetical protein